MTASNSIFTHILHFSDNREMGYCLGVIHEFIQTSPVLSSTSNEFDGDAPYEIVVTTARPVAQAAINAIVKHFAPEDHQFNLLLQVSCKL